MGIDHNKRLKEHLYYYSARISRDISNLIKWLVLAVVTGCIVGAASTLFSFTLKTVTGYRKVHEWIFLLLPLSGLIIVFLYEKLGKEDGGTNQVLSTVRSRDDVPILSAPLIFITTALTHLTGGSAGREGAAIQLGGSIANQLGRWIHLDEEDRHVIVMCGMSAAFSALFGTPMAAAVFALEVVSVGVMYYAALMPCMIASLVASGFAAGMGITPESFHVTDIPALTIESGLKMGVVALGCAVVSIVFCIALNGAAGLYAKWFKNKYVRVVAGACLVIAVTFMLRTNEYMGAGAELIEKAVENGQADTFAFFWKMVLTALTMRAGFRGGEIVPSFCIGATFGCVMGNLMGISPSICAACGMAAVFCGVTNCPITSILIAFEMFGFKGVSFYLIAVSISYAASGYYGLYKDQTIVYSKYKAKYVNRHTRF
ncbi:chloride channel protein [Blautia sp. CLA-JM-H16]|uniref:Chloride channel protein n=1 Tax=Blautia aquisgranensis TaxID=3133153 RepID=A0ABV1BHC7_9FIRM